MFLANIGFAADIVASAPYLEDLTTRTSVLLTCRDPANTGKHLGPRGQGHRGDLPVLRVDVSGNATNAVIAPHLKVADVKGRSIMIHAGGDNYSDQPDPLGGGGARIACGVVK